MLFKQQLLVISTWIFASLLSNATFAKPEELDEDGNPIVKIDKAPLWTLPDGTETFSSEQFEGKGYVIHFWASWNPYCKQVQPGLHSIAKQYEAEGLKTIAISFWENPKADPSRDLIRRGISFKSLVNGDDVAKAFDVTLPPTTIFIDDDSNIVERITTTDPNDPAIRAAYEKLLDAI